MPPVRDQYSVPCFQTSSTWIDEPSVNFSRWAMIGPDGCVAGGGAMCFDRDWAWVFAQRRVAAMMTGIILLGLIVTFLSYRVRKLEKIVYKNYNQYPID